MPDQSETRPQRTADEGLRTFDSRQFRNALGRFATGVTVITFAGEDRTHATTVNSFVSVSLNPPLVLVSLDHRSSMHRILSALDQNAAVRYGISVLAEDQQVLSDHFAGRAPEAVHARYATHQAVPLLEGAIAHFVVRVTEAHPAGDHTLYIGEVEHFESREGRPLLFHSGRYGNLQPEKRREPWDEFSLFSIGNIDPTP